MDWYLKIFTKDLYNKILESNFDFDKYFTFRFNFL